MEIVWDEIKRSLNLAKHKLDFTALTGEWFLVATVVPARDGRLKAIGRLNNMVVAVVFTRLGSEAVSIISMRPARRDERSQMHE